MWKRIHDYAFRHPFFSVVLVIVAQPFWIGLSWLVKGLVADMFLSNVNAWIFQHWSVYFAAWILWTLLFAAFFLWVRFSRLPAVAIAQPAGLAQREYSIFTARELLLLYEGKTAIQGNKDLEDHFGLWTSALGNVESVEVEDSTILVRLSHGAYRFKCRFSLEWRPELHRVSPRAELTIHGEVARHQDGRELYLVNCELPKSLSDQIGDEIADRLITLIERAHRLEAPRAIHQRPDGNWEDSWGWDYEFWREDAQKLLIEEMDLKIRATAFELCLRPKGIYPTATWLSKERQQATDRLRAQREILEDLLASRSSNKHHKQTSMRQA